MYLYEEQYYLLSNLAVARNTLFCDVGIQLHFRGKMKYYLEPLCDILAFNLKDNEFQILVRLKKRKAFEEFYQSKILSKGHLTIPESTYIFSQAMSNLQNSTVKKFNRKYNRRGTLMARRFQRELILNKDNVIEIIQNLNKGKQDSSYSGIWADSAMKRIKEMTSERIYKNMEMKYEGIRGAFWNDIKDNLVGKFELSTKNDQLFKFHFLQRRLFNSICKFLE